MMKRKRRLKSNRIYGSRGESMIMVVVMLMVFMILGCAVLTASASATAASSARVSERQAYYYARSMLDVLDESMREGKLGKALCEKIMHELVVRNVNSIHYQAGEGKALKLVYEPEVEHAPLNEMTLSPITITCVGKATSNTPAVGELITQATLQLRTVDLSFSVTHQGQTTRMHIQYRATCRVEDYNDAQARKWTQWAWTIQEVG